MGVGPSWLATKSHTAVQAAVATALWTFLPKTCVRTSFYKPALPARDLRPALRTAAKTAREHGHSHCAHCPPARADALKRRKSDEPQLVQPPGLARRREINESTVRHRAARCVDPSKCPFRDDGEVKFQLARGEVVWLQGPSGVGKTTLAAEVAGLGSARRLGIHVTVEWDASIDKRERVGALFQQTTLVDALSVGGNVANALAACGVHSVEEPKRLVEAVGLDWARDGRKMPQELSGGWRVARLWRCN